MIKTVKIYNDDIGEVSLIDYMGNDKRAAHAARVSFLKDDLNNNEFTEKDGRLINFLLREKHTSPFEHSTITFRLTVPAFIRSQIHRHRTFSYNEASRRYTSDDLSFYSPDNFRKQAEKNLQASIIGSDFDPVLKTINGSVMDYTYTAKELLNDHIDASLDLYNMMLKNGVCREQARMVLPQNMYCSFWMTGSLHNYIKFLSLRLTPHAQPEVQAVAQAMLDMLIDIFPETFKAIDF